MSHKALEFGTLEISLLRDIAGDSARLIRMRWLFGASVVAGTYLWPRLTDWTLPQNLLYGIGTTILLYNGLMGWLAQQSKHLAALDWQRRNRQILWSQIILDGLLLAALLHATGGIASPVLLLLFVNVVIAAVFLPGRRLPYLGIVWNLGLLALVAAAEGRGLLPHYHLIPIISANIHTNLPIVVAQLTLFTSAACVLVYFTTALTARLREWSRQTGVHIAVIRSISESATLNEFLEKLTRHATEMLLARGAVLFLLEKNDYHAAAIYGVAQSQLGEAHTPIAQHLLDAQLLTGDPVILNRADTDIRARCPELITEQGIHSMMSVPILGRHDPLGVLCLFSDQSDHFGDREVAQARAIASQCAAVIDQTRNFESLEKADQARTQFVRTITHELRAPVGGAQTLIRTLLQGITGDLTAQQQDILKRLEARLDNLLLLINDLLEFAASKTVDLEATLKPVLLKPVLQQIVDRLSPDATSKEITLNLDDLPLEELSVRATEDGLGRIFMNLIGNAIKYTPNGGRVYVRVVEQQTDVIISVSDNGMGIPKEDLPRLWESFFRARNAKQSNIVGTGLGLSIVKQLVDHFDGRISVHSVEGEGTTFKVLLQRASPADDTPLPPK